MIKQQLRPWLLVAAIGFTVQAMAVPEKKTTKKPFKFIDQSNMDPAVKPGDNFYLYANGTWLKNNAVPASKTSWGSFMILRQESSERIRTLLQEAAANTGKDRTTQMIGDFYASGMDSAAIEAKGYQPIKADLDQIAGVGNMQDLVMQMATMRTMGYGGGFVSVGVSPDSKNVSKYIPGIGQGGTTLPDRDYYLKNDSRSMAVRSAYKNYVQQLFTLVGQSPAQAAAAMDAVLRIETALAKMQYTRVELRDPYKRYNKFSVKDLSATTPSLNWETLLPMLKINGADSILVSNPGFLKTADALLSAVPLADWKAYLQWNVLKRSAPYLSSAFIDAGFKYNQALSGQKEQTPRWQRMSALIDGSLGEQLGQLYVQRYFKPEAKQRMLDLVNNLQSTFEDRIKRVDWMSDETKQRGIEKLHAFTKKIAYPDKWKDYQGVVINRNDFLANVRSSDLYDYNEMVSHMGKPVDKTQWGMTPPTINAYYSPGNNEIVFPAAILQFPFFDFGADDAVNYGGIGAVIGHEMTHGFDDQGRQFAADGNLKDWWTKTDADNFKTRADKVVNQYNNFTVLDTVHVNGKLTLGENLADLGGLNIAYEAFTKTPEFKEGKKIDGLTPTQRFFLSWAQVWRSNALPETQAQLILTDPHSPGMSRANGPIVNIDAWYEAFNIQPGDKMYVAPADRIHIW